MNQKNSPIDIDAFKRLVESNQGISRQAAMNELQRGLEQNPNTSRTRMGSAQQKALKAGWLFIQRKGGLSYFFTVGYAKEHNIPKKTTGDRPSQTKSKQWPQDDIDICARAARISRLMPASNRTYNGVTF